MSETVRSGDYIEIRPEQVTTSELRQLIRTPMTVEERILMLHALRQRPDITAVEKLQDLNAVLMNSQEDAHLRFTAATEIGRIGNQQSQALLFAALEQEVSSAKSELVIRGAASALLLSGADNAERVPQILANRPDVLPGLRFPLTLYAYRKNLELRDMGAPEITVEEQQLLPVRPRLAQSVQFEATSADIANEAATKAEELIQAVSFERSQVTTVKCGDENLVFVPVTHAFGQENLARLSTVKNLVGVVSVYYHLETETWEPKYVVVSQPSKQVQTIELIVLATTGEPALVGIGNIDKGDNTFVLTAVDKPGAVPAEIKGQFRDDAVVFLSASSELRTIRRKNPSPA